MKMRTDGKKKNRLTITAHVLTLCLLVLSVAGASTFAWFSSRKSVGSYAPISSPEALYIGAGHIENDTFEDIRYMYFDGMDVKKADHVDKVFCVYGTGIGNYKIQLAFTTNNQFIYSIYHASESSVESEGAVKYVTHQTTPQTFYYSVSGEAIAGTFLNKQEVEGESIANAENHTDTYGSYANVNKYAEPIYWQTSVAETGRARGAFVNYYILRVSYNGKEVNDRETDVLCLAAKTFNIHAQS
ncbi:MAG: hypothetical protein J5697_02490 [Clostridia bacterium]|nr:hypothetical protein [Clostridia bacterium]